MAMRTGVRGPVTAALVATAALLGGLGGVLLGLIALVLVADAALPVPGVSLSEADARFRAAERRRRRAERMRRLRRMPAKRLDVIDDRTGWAATAQRRPLGVQAIPIDSVTATLEPFKARSFDRSFRPDRASAEHWKRIWVAQARGASLPPVAVYRVGCSHVVRDGHHRISVALDRGQASIEADVVELLPRAA
jgi:hypothetical protein